METSGPNLECRMYEAKFPAVDAIVMIKVKSITNSGEHVAALLEYNNIEGYLSKSHCDSLIDVGRIEPLKVVSVDEEKGYVDLSQRELFKHIVDDCEERFKKSKAVHSVMRGVAETVNIDIEDLYILFGWPLYEKYGHAFEAFKLIENGDRTVLGLVPLLVKDALLKNVSRMTKVETEAKFIAKIKMTCFSFDGVLHIQEAMRKAEASGEKDCPVKMLLLEAPLYALKAKTLTEEKGIAILNKAIEACREEIESHQGKLIVVEAAREVKKSK